MCSSYLCAIVPLSFLFLCSSYVLYVLLFLFQISFVPPIFVVLFLCSSYLFFIVSSVHYPLFLLSMFYFSPVHVYFFLLPMCYCSSSKFFCSSYFCSIVPLPFLCLSYLLMYICSIVPFAHYPLFLLSMFCCFCFLLAVVPPILVLLFSCPCSAVPPFYVLVFLCFYSDILLSMFCSSPALHFPCLLQILYFCYNLSQVQVGSVA